MPGAEPALVHKHLETLRIRQLAEWDVLAFIHRHGTSIASAEQIARLLGYGNAPVGAALDGLASAGLVQRSRNAHGVRLYRCTANFADESRRRSLEELMKVAEERQGRLLILRHLQQAAAGHQRRLRGGLHLA